MAAIRYLSVQQAEQAYLERLELRKRTAATHTGSYFLDSVIRTLEDRYGPDVVYHGGLKVSTTLDPRMQSMALESIRKNMIELDTQMGLGVGTAGDLPQSALVTVETNTGAVRALVGGRDYLQSEYNRALHNNRLPGSVF